MGDALVGRRALVTGASRGIGRAVALELAGLGADVAVTARTVAARDDKPGSVGETVRQLEAVGARALGIAADLRRPDDVERVVSEALAAFGHLDILVNNAAYMADSMYEPFWRMSSQVWRDQVEVNVNAPFALMKGLAPGMTANDGGLVVNVTSAAAALRPLPQPMPGAGGTGAGYGTTKAAVSRMSNMLGNELRPDNIVVVALDPGSTLTENYPRMAEDYGFDVSRTHPMNVPAKVVAFLATCDDPLQYAGQVVVARDFAAEHGLFSP